MKILYCSIVMVILIFVGISYAETPLSLSDAVNIALESHPDIAIADQGILKSMTTLDHARSELFPRLDLTLNSRYVKTIEEFEPIQITFDLLGTSQTISPTKDVPKYQSDISLQVTQRLFTGGRITGRIEGSKGRINQTKMIKETDKRNIALSVIKAYWELKRAEKIAGIERERVQHSESILGIANTRYEKGAISGLEREKAMVDLLNNQQDLLQATTTKKVAEDRLLKEMGIIKKEREFDLFLQDEPIYNFFKPDEDVIEKSIEQALSLRPEIRQVKELILANEADVKAVKSDYYPHLDLVGEYNWIGFSRDSLNDSWRDIDSNYWLVLLKLNFNLFEGFATKSKVLQAKSELAAAKMELEKQRQVIIQDVRRIYYNLVGNAEKINILEKNVALAKRNLEAAMKQFELGVATINQVEEYNLSLADTKKRYINALIDFEIAKAEFKWVSGEELP